MAEMVDALAMSVPAPGSPPASMPAPAMTDGVTASRGEEPAEAGATAQELSRRTFHAYLAGSLASFIGLVVGLPVVGYLAAPLATKVKATWISVGRAETFKAGPPKLVNLSIARQDGWRQIAEARTAWVRALAGDQFLVFNGRCTHLGCAYSWKAEGDHANAFYCPCHDGVYDADGNVTAGPPPRPLDRLEAKVDNGDLLVLYQDFRLGTPQKEGA